MHADATVPLVGRQPLSESGALSTLSVPLLESLRTYRLSDLRNDLVAGLTVAAVTIPQAMGYALVAGLPPVVGIYTALVTCAAAAVLSPSRYLVHGPTNAISIAVFSALSELGLSTVEQKLHAAIALSCMVGCLQVAFALFRAGDLTRFISRGVLLGFMVAAAVLITLTQIPHLLGSSGLYPYSLQPYTVAVAAFTALLLFLLRLLAAWTGFRLPDMFLALLGASLLVWCFGWDEKGVAVVGSIPSALPRPSVPTLGLAELRQLSGPALAISILGLLEALAIARSLAMRENTAMEPNQQCLSEGVANLTGSLFGCMPGSGSFTRSAVNYSAGARTQVSSIFASLFVAAAVLYLGPLARYVPLSSLATILVVAAWRMVEWKDLGYFLRATRSDAAVVVVTALAGVLISVEFAILAGSILSVLLYMPRAARLYLSELVVTSEGVVRERTAADPVCTRLAMFNLEGELFFGSAPSLEEAIQLMRLRITPETKAVLIRLKRVRNADATCLEILHRFVEQLVSRGVTVFLCGVRPDLAPALRRTGIVQLIGPERLFREQPDVWSSTLQAVRAAYEVLGQDLCDRCPRRQGRQAEAWYYVI